MAHSMTKKGAILMAAGPDGRFSLMESFRCRPAAGAAAADFSMQLFVAACGRPGRRLGVYGKVGCMDGDLKVMLHWRAMVDPPRVPPSNRSRADQPGSPRAPRLPPRFPGPQVTLDDSVMASLTKTKGSRLVVAPRLQARAASRKYTLVMGPE